MVPPIGGQVLEQVAPRPARVPAAHGTRGQRTGDDIGCPQRRRRGSNETVIADEHYRGAVRVPVLLAGVVHGDVGPPWARSPPGSPDWRPNGRGRPRAGCAARRAAAPRRPSRRGPCTSARGHRRQRDRGRARGREGWLARSARSFRSPAVAGRGRSGRAPPGSECRCGSRQRTATDSHEPHVQRHDGKQRDAAPAAGVHPNHARPSAPQGARPDGQVDCPRRESFRRVRTVYSRPCSRKMPRSTFFAAAGLI